MIFIQSKSIDIIYVRSDNSFFFFFKFTEVPQVGNLLEKCLRGERFVQRGHRKKRNFEMENQRVRSAWRHIASVSWTLMNSVCKKQVERESEK